MMRRWLRVRPQSVRVASSACVRRVSSSVGRALVSALPAPASTSIRCRPTAGVSVLSGVRAFASAKVDVVPLAMPALSPTMERGNLPPDSWRKKVGDKINAGDILCDVETDKAVVSFEATESGYLAAILVPNGTKDIPLGKVLAFMVDAPADIDAAKAQGLLVDSTTAAAAAAPKPAAASAAPAAAASAATAAPVANASAASIPPPSGKKGYILSPAALHMVNTLGLDPNSILHTGKDGRLTKADVVNAVKAGTAKPASASGAASTPAAAAAPKAAAAKAAATPSAGGRAGARRSYVDSELSNMRRTIASRLTQSKSTIPHAYVTGEAQIDTLMAVRAQLKAKYNSGASVNDFVIRAAALACRAVPECNAVWDAKAGAARVVPDVDISVAVATDSGLITPIVKHADTKRLDAINAEVKALAGKAKAGKLQPAEFIGGSFTISNLGMFGISEFSAVINPPQACILAVATSVQRVVNTAAPRSALGPDDYNGPLTSSPPPAPVAAAAGKAAAKPAAKPTAAAAPAAPAAPAFKSVPILTVTLSYDERVVDASAAARWLAAFRRNIEDPNATLL